MTQKLLHADYHRNGVTADGFYVGLFHDTELKRTMLITWFPEYEADGETLLADQNRIAVIDPAEAAKGNVYMYPTGDQPGNNAWRGDHFGHVARKMPAFVHATFNAQMAELRKRAEAGSDLPDRG